MKLFGPRGSRRNATTLLPLLTGLLLSLGPAPSPARAAENREDLTTAITRVARETIPSVVHIEVTERTEFTHPRLPFEFDPFFRRFFGNPKAPRKFKEEVKSLGSGMILDARGHILTNHHVVSGATKIQVLLSDGRKLPARTVGTDPKTDLAVIRIADNAPLPPPVRFGDSDKVAVGEWVVAIGHPRGLDESVTQGIISAKHRRGVVDPGSYEDFLQTDAAINPGNSGGPLLNLRGEVVGVNAAISSESGGFEGIGFTIPSNIALHIARTLIARGKVDRGWLGLSAEDAAQGGAGARRAGAAKGALVGSVVPDGPAARAGLRPNDVIVAYNGKDVPDAVGLRNDVANSPIGRDARITIDRDGKRQDVTVRIGSPGEELKILSASARALLGAGVRAPTAKERETFGLDKEHGVAVDSLESEGPLSKAGFEAGDVILEINGQAVGGVASFVEIVGSMRHRQKIALIALDHRTGDTASVTIALR